MAAVLPRAPNSRESREALLAKHTRQIILAFVTWRMRLIPAKPRTVKFWSGGVPPLEARAAAAALEPFLKKVEAGEDLTPHLSNLVNTKGIILPGARPGDRGKDVDLVLAREGLHHFHIGVASPTNRTGRSDQLVFAHVLKDEFRIIALAGHGVFEKHSPEALRFLEISRSYMARDIPPGQGFMANPVMSSGHSMLVTGFALKCEDQIRLTDPLLDDPAFVGKLYDNGAPIVIDGKVVPKPASPKIKWHFEDLQFGVLDKDTNVFFCFFPFFER